MGRPRREIQLDVPHHIAHRGNHRKRLFESDDDRRYYLSLVYRFSRMSGTHIAGFCLMSNHVHFIAVPTTIKSLSSCFARAHRKYSEYLNQRIGEHGTNWEGRFFSVPMGESHALNALRYIERNPVDAGIVKDAVDWHWSSAQMHCGVGRRWGLVDLDIRPETISGQEWKRLLKNPLDEEELLSVPWAAVSAPRGSHTTGAFTPSALAGAGMRGWPYEAPFDQARVDEAGVDEALVDEVVVDEASIAKPPKTTQAASTRRRRRKDRRRFGGDRASGIRR